MVGQDETNVKILIVEDEAIIAADIKEKLEKQAYTVCGHATSSEQAILMTQAERPDLVLMDIILEGEMDGINAAQVIRSKYNTPVVFLTAHADKERLERAKLVFPFGYLVKPFHEIDLKVTIEMALCAYRLDAKRKRAEDALRDSEAKYRNLFDNSPVGIGIMDMEGHIVDYNEAILEPGGYRPEDIGRIGNLFQLFYDPEERKSVLVKAQRQGFIDEIEVRLLRKDGTSYDANMSLRPLRIKGKPYWHAIIQDVTEKKRITEILQKSEERYALAVQAGQVGVWDWDLATGRIYVDPMLKAILGFDDYEIANHLDEWGQRVHPEDGDIVMKAANDHIQGLTPCYKVEHRMLHKDGSIRWFLAHGNVIRNEKGQPVRMIGTDQDITDRKLVENERERLIEELKGALAEVKTLSGFLPICSKCKKIRDDKGYWQGVEKYIQERSDAQFSHSLCPDCAKQLYPDIFEDES